MVGEIFMLFCIDSACHQIFVYGVTISITEWPSETYLHFSIFPWNQLTPLSFFRLNDQYWIENLYKPTFDNKLLWLFENVITYKWITDERCRMTPDLKSGSIQMMITDNYCTKMATTLFIWNTRVIDWSLTRNSELLINQSVTV